MSHPIRPLVIAVMLVASACAADRARFHPTEVAGTGHAGQPAAVYELRASPAGASQVEVKLWSRGAYEEEARTFVQLAMEMRNTSDRPITLDTSQLRLQAFDEDGRSLPGGQLGTPSAPTTIRAGAASTIRLVFTFPDRVDPDDISTMRLRWALARTDGSRYVQFTDFQRVPEPEVYGYGAWSYHDPVFGYYDPFFYGPPYTHHYNYATPVRRVIVVDRDRPRTETQVRRRSPGRG